MTIYKIKPLAAIGMQQKTFTGNCHTTESVVDISRYNVRKKFLRRDNFRKNVLAVRQFTRTIFSIFSTSAKNYLQCINYISISMYQYPTLSVSL